MPAIRAERDAGECGKHLSPLKRLPHYKRCSLWEPAMPAIPAERDVWDCGEHPSPLKRLLHLALQPGGVPVGVVANASDEASP